MPPAGSNATRRGAAPAAIRPVYRLPLSGFAAEKPAFLAEPGVPLEPGRSGPAGEAGRGTLAPLRRRFLGILFPPRRRAPSWSRAALSRSSYASPRASAEEQAAIGAASSPSPPLRTGSGLVTEAESSLARERQILERSVASAVEYLQARLNIKIERRESPKTL